jgi:ubiquinone/menaquinone biosynthesis C-methylase UbiE
MSTVSASPNVQNGSNIEPFDSIAAAYDGLFTATSIGKAQRAQVATELNRRFQAGDCVLELNCGTGEDAIALGHRGVEVSAFDSSYSMIAVAKLKLQANSCSACVQFGILRNEDLGSLAGSFDGAFSNFAGMNCSHDWQGIATDLARLVKPGGHVLLCIMGRACLWEVVYFLMRGQVGKAFRRRSYNQVARVGTSSVDVYYASVRDAQRDFSKDFTLCRWRGVGIFVPPSYCEQLFAGRNWMVRLFTAIDRVIGHLPGIRCLADHVLLDFVRSTA